VYLIKNERNGVGVRRSRKVSTFRIRPLTQGSLGIGGSALYHGNVLSSGFPEQAVEQLNPDLCIAENSGNADNL